MAVRWVRLLLVCEVLLTFARSQICLRSGSSLHQGILYPPTTLPCIHLDSITRIAVRRTCPPAFPFASPTAFYNYHLRFPATSGEYYFASSRRPPSPSERDTPSVVLYNLGNMDNTREADGQARSHYGQAELPNPSKKRFERNL